MSQPIIALDNITVAFHQKKTDDYCGKQRLCPC